MPPVDKTKAQAATATPLYEVLGEVAIFWTLANLGYFLILPALGFDLSYNSAPIAIAAYFLVWAIMSVFYFWDLFSHWLSIDTRIWLYGLVSLGFAGVVWAVLYVLTQLPQLKGLPLAPYTDLLFATPWYFLPKAVEILVQQVLITALVLALDFRLDSLPKVNAAFILTFGGAHILMFALSGAPTPHAALMTVGAALSGFIFPYFVLRVKGGFVYNYILHFLFYLTLALALRVWPMPGDFSFLL